MSSAKFPNTRAILEESVFGLADEDNIELLIDALDQLFTRLAYGFPLTRITEGWDTEAILRNIVGPCTIEYVSVDQAIPFDRLSEHRIGQGHEIGLLSYATRRTNSLVVEELGPKLFEKLGSSIRADLTDSGIDVIRWLDRLNYDQFSYELVTTITLAVGLTTLRNPHAFRCQLALVKLMAGGLMPYFIINDAQNNSRTVQVLHM